MKLKRNGGFTLIELLVVVAIISLFSSVVLASLNSSRAKARDARRLSDLHQLDNALALYASDHGGAYPGVFTTSWYYISDDQIGLGPYIPNITNFKDSKGNIYGYTITNSSNTAYRSCSYFELTANQGITFIQNGGNSSTGCYERK